MLRIVIAAWHLKDFNVGLGRYCRGLVEGLGRIDRENSYEILMPDDSYRFPSFPNVRYRLIRFPVFKRRFWEQTAPLLAGRHDILHIPYDSCVGWKRAKLVTTVHDLKPLLFGTASSGFNLNTQLERLIVRDKWAQIDHIVTDSKSSRDDLIRLQGVPVERITVVYPGVDLERFRPDVPVEGSGAERRSTFDVPSSEEGRVPDSTMNHEPRTTSRPYVLCVAGSDPTKNVDALIEAFAALPAGLRDRCDLVVVGDLRRRPELWERVTRAGLESQVRFPGIVDDQQLILWYQRAHVFVFPSRYEGFGLPVLEAMACGCPVVSSNASSLPEVAGEAALLVRPEDVEGLSHAIARVLGDSTVRLELRSRGLTQAGRFSWDRTAREMLGVYEQVAAS